MKTLWTVFVALIFFAIIFVGPTSAEVKNITAIFDYPTIDPNNIRQPVTCILYRNGIKECEKPFTVNHSFTCDAIFTKNDIEEIDGVWNIKADFTLSVKDNMNEESDQSEVYVYIKPVGNLPLLPAPTNLLTE